MIRRLIFLVIIAICLAYPPIESSAAGLRKGSNVSFELKDGSIISGKLMDVTEVFYMVELTDGGMKTVFFSELKSAPESPQKKELTLADLQATLQAHPDIQQQLKTVMSITADMQRRIAEVKQESSKKLSEIMRTDSGPDPSLQISSDSFAETSKIINKAIGELEALPVLPGFEKSNIIRRKQIDYISDLAKDYGDLASFYEHNVKPFFGTEAFEINAKKFINDVRGIKSRHPDQGSQIMDEWQKRFLEDFLEFAK